MKKTKKNNNKERRTKNKKPRITIKNNNQQTKKKITINYLPHGQIFLWMPAPISSRATGRPRNQMIYQRHEKYWKKNGNFILDLPEKRVNAIVYFHIFIKCLSRTFICKCYVFNSLFFLGKAQKQLLFMEGATPVCKWRFC